MKRILKIAVLLILLTIGTASQNKANAQTPYKTAVENLLNIQDTKDLMIQTVATSWNSMGMQFTQPTDKVAKEIINKIWPDLVADYAKVYAKYFTLSEIEALTSFYMTPLGTKLVRALPAITAETQQIVAEKYTNRIAEYILPYIKM